MNHGLQVERRLPHERLSRTPTLPPLVVGIAGGTASGKTQLARLLAEQLPGAVVTISQDWYYHDRSMRTPEEERAFNVDHPDAFDYALLRDHLVAVKAGRPVRAPRYDYATHCRTGDGVWLSRTEVVLLEGLLVLHDARLRELIDVSVFVDVSAEVRLTRRLQRDVNERGISLEETTRLYEHCVRPMHDKFVQPSIKHAGIVWRPEENADFPVRLVQWIQEMRAGLAD